MSADVHGMPHNRPASDSADFCLTPEEVEKGEQAATVYIASLRDDEGRRGAEEALGTLATVISGGVCDDLRFPWHQVRAYHCALALSIVKGRGAPTKVELLRCRHDDTRKFQQVPEVYETKHVQRMRVSLRRVIEECCNLGFIDEAELDQARLPARSNAKGNGKTKAPRERVLTEAETHALLSACAMGRGSTRCRDALMISLAWEGGLKTVDLINLGLSCLDFDNRQGHMTVKVKASGAKRARRVPLGNDELIALEDWLEVRGRAEGPLFCPVVRGRPFIGRLSAADVKKLCDERAAQAGVLAFSPNDLAKCGPHGAESLRRKRNEVKEADIPVLSPLYGAATDEVKAPGPERIRFPYRVRVGR